MLSFHQQLARASLRLQSAIVRIQLLSQSQGRDVSRRSEPVSPPSLATSEALAFNLERAAWAMIDLAQAWVFEWRLGLPRKETENFDLLQRHGKLDLETTRRYKQLCEFRTLSMRQSDRTDWTYILGDLSAELALIEAWDRQQNEWLKEHG